MLQWHALSSGLRLCFGDSLTKRSCAVAPSSFSSSELCIIEPYFASDFMDRRLFLAHIWEAKVRIQYHSKDVRLLRFLLRQLNKVCLLLKLRRPAFLIM